ncbi:L-rhamnose mutarotase [Streptomyces fagopyri]|uniref:L-rhamnose mutarotase n=1 Tax=Streptomyces fagopyri TaxID=2662397 RepID=UPI00369B990A
MTRRPARRAFVVGVRPGKREEQLAPHRAVWPDVERKLTECTMRDYSVLIFDDIPFAYYEYLGEDHEADMRRIADDPVSRERWPHTDPCRARTAEERDPGALWRPVDEVRHLS